MQRSTQSRLRLPRATIADTTPILISSDREMCKTYPLLPAGDLVRTSPTELISRPPMQ